MRYVDTTNPVVSHHPLNQGLVGWWMALNPTSGGRQFFDLLQLCPGTLTNLTGAGAGWRAQTRVGSLGPALRFTNTGLGAAAEHVTVGNPTRTQLTGNVSMSIWFNADAFTVVNARLFVKQVTANANPFINYGIYLPGASTAAFWHATGGSGTGTSATTGATLGTDTWHHITGTYDGSNIRIYHNGRLIATTAQAGGTTGNNASTLYFGGNPQSGIANETFDGWLDDGRIWDRALSADEVEWLYHESLAGYPETLARVGGQDAFHTAAAPDRAFRPTYGPPMPGVPWLDFRRPPLTRFLPSPTSLTPEVVTPPQIMPQPVRVGPPVVGAPWTQFFRLPFPRPIGDNTPPSPPTPTGPGRGKSRPYIARIPRNLKGRINERRQARTSEQIHYIINSLITRGELRQIGPSSWILVSGGHTAEDNPGANDDISNGFTVGSTWVNTVTQQAWVCVDNTLTNAIWKQVTA